MEAEEATWEKIKGWGSELLSRIPYVGPALPLAWGVWEMLKKRRLLSAATTGVQAINRFKHLAERVKDALSKPDAATDWEALGRDTTILLDELRRAGQEGSAAWQELGAIHDGLKAKAAAAVTLAE
jgi:hypothetical protein